MKEAFIRNTSSNTAKKYHDISPLGTSVKRSLENHLGSTIHRVLFQNNADKYHNIQDPLKTDSELSEVFHIMRSLNHQAITSETLGSTPSNPQNFVDALLKIIDSIADQAGNQPLQYIELGPEPVKTSYIIRQLLARGITIDSYTGVDINPASEGEMRTALAHVLTPSQIFYHNSLFSEFRANSLRKKGTQILATMLGFQEGNDEPKTMRKWLSSMLEPQDLLLSEMQLFQRSDTSKIVEFYQHPLMKAFSKIAFKRTFDRTQSQYQTYTLPVKLENETLHTMIMCEAFQEIPQKKSLFITNYCIKYSALEFQLYREYNNLFTILHESLTGDKSIVFQLSQKR